jgi:hypothetical protein
VKCEFDLKACFNNLELISISEVLRNKLKLPTEFVNYLLWINSMPPRNMAYEFDSSDAEVRQLTIDASKFFDNQRGGLIGKKGLPQGLP